MNTKNNERIFNMLFSKVYPAIVKKAERKDKTREEVDTLTTWLTGYTSEEIQQAMNNDVTYGDFFKNAPQINQNAKLIKGVICGIRVENIEDETIQQMRYLDKMVDELYKGKSMEKILRK